MIDFKLKKSAVVYKICLPTEAFAVFLKGQCKSFVLVCVCDTGKSITYSTSI